MREMKFMPLLFLLLVFFSGCGDSMQKTDIEMENLSGKVRSYQEISYEAIMLDGAAVKGARKREFPWSYDRRKEFNESGFIVKDCHLGSSEEKTFCYKNIYDEKNRKLESIGVDAAGDIKEKTFFQYNEKGEALEHRSFVGDILKEAGKYEYDSDGNIAAAFFYNASGEMESKEYFQYNEKGFLTEKRILSPENQIENCFIYKRDKKGNMLEMKFFRKDMEPGGTYSYQRDKKGNIVEEHFYHSNGTLLNKTIFRYKYDKQGNWIEKTVLKEKTATFILERTIEYY
ncbi:hypothetical protein LJB78_00080 [Bacteroidales bacterium OttesenSCG-928-J16]|nr:hypothetical protein [Bacteroidales bacterium OttesenSCG-928-J16]